eukprot:TRINITY_DN65098_c0_g1_i1.p3 TRINITY_DN65098_c0_g1~~TRINITY_DN65098_c0_g1_i1.p3  ORF type:complete len:104 (-),score=35.16 TRINITY_DN65098_c0_g1_i1:190-501(-)
MQEAEEKRRDKLRAKMEEERAKKQERIEQGKQEFDSWMKKWQKQIKEKKATKAEEQQSKKTSFENPWEKVIATVDIKEGGYPGSKDVSRMRAVIQSRKADPPK